MNRLAVAALRVLLVILFAAALGTQLWIIPNLAAECAQWYPELAYLAVPYAVIAIAVVACVQVAFVSVWMLLGKVRRGAIFSPSAFRWVNGIIAAGVLATVLVAGVEIHILGPVNVGGPALVIMLAGIVVVGAAFTLVMLVMRGLLRQATQLQSELEEVV